MKRNNIGWSGAVGPAAPDPKGGQFDLTPYREALGNRFIPAIGQPALSRIFRQGGTVALVDENNEIYRKLFEQADDLFKTGRAKGFGELILNNKQTNPDVSFRRKVAIDAAPFKTMAEIAQRNSGFLQIHAEDDSDSVQQIKNLATQFPNVPIILSHCMESVSTGLIKELLLSHPNLYCELSARSALFFFTGAPPQKIAHYSLYDNQSFRPDWIALVDDLPTRFMLGSDTFRQDIDIDKVIFQLRNGVLANLKPETIELVASGNAIRVLKLLQ